MQAVPRHAFEIRQAVERHVDFAGGPAELVALHAFHEIIGQIAGLDHLGKRKPRIDAGRNHVSVNFVAAREHNAGGASVLDHDAGNRGPGADFNSGLASGVGNSVGDGAGAATRKSPGSEGSVDFAHVVMQQNVGGAGRAHAEKSSDNARGRHRRLEHIGLKPLIEKVGGAHGHELDLVVLVAARHALETASDEEQLHQFSGIERHRVGRDHAEDGLHEAAHCLHGLAKFVVGFGVNAGVAGNFAMRLAVIVHAPQIVAAGHGSEGAVERQNLEAVAGKFEVANDFGPQQRDYVRANGKLEPGKNFVGASRAAEDVAAFEHQHFLSRFRQIGGVDEAVVASSNHDHVVLGRARNRRHRLTLKD